MKTIKHIFKIIWNEKRINAWIITELVLIFTILWFCCDYLHTMGMKYLKPVGFDITNTYNVSIGTLPENMTGEVSKEDKVAAYDKILERIQTSPLIESVCVSAYATPYTGSWQSTEYMIDSTKIGGTWTKHVSPEYFDVFKIGFSDGRSFNANEMLSGKYAILGLDENETIGGFGPRKIDTLYRGRDGDRYQVSGFVNKVKRSEYDSYSAIVYVPISPDLKVINSWNTTISIRVKPEADTKDFKNVFAKEMRTKLDISPYFFIDIEPTSNIRENYMKWNGYDNSLKSTFSITAFLVINIFLGIIGTFWLRTQSRKGEIGLQMALGASRNKIRNMYVVESLIILFIASLIGTILAVNIMATGAFDNLGLPMMQNTELKDAKISQFIIDYLLTFGLLAIITSIAVWYPSQRASKTSPALVLRSE